MLNHAGDQYVVAGACSNVNTEVWWKSNDVYLKAQQRDLPFVSNEKRNEAALLDLVHSQSIDMLISVQHSWILPDSILRAVNYQALNLHNAKLPRYKGYYTGNHAILNGDKTYTSTIHWMVKNVDEGPIAFEETIPIHPEDTAIRLYEKSSEAAVLAFEKLLNHLVEEKEIPRQPLIGSGTFYSKTDLDNVRQIHNPSDPDEVDRKARALFFPPSEPAFYLEQNRKIHVLPQDYAGYVEDIKEFLKPFQPGSEEIAYVVAGQNEVRSL